MYSLSTRVIYIIYHCHAKLSYIFKERTCLQTADDESYKLTDLYNINTRVFRCCRREIKKKAEKNNQHVDGIANEFLLIDHEPKKKIYDERQSINIESYLEKKLTADENLFLYYFGNSYLYEHK